MGEVKRAALLSPDENNPLDFHFITRHSFVICFEEKKLEIYLTNIIIIIIDKEILFSRFFSKNHSCSQFRYCTEIYIELYINIIEIKIITYLSFLFNPFYRPYHFPYSDSN